MWRNSISSSSSFFKPIKSSADVKHLDQNDIALATLTFSELAPRQSSLVPRALFCAFYRQHEYRRRVRVAFLCQTQYPPQFGVSAKTGRPPRYTACCKSHNFGQVQLALRGIPKAELGKRMLLSRLINFASRLIHDVLNSHNPSLGT
jgi:hypothetical protein